MSERAKAAHGRAGTEGTAPGTEGTAPGTEGTAPGIEGTAGNRPVPGGRPVRPPGSRPAHPAAADQPTAAGQGRAAGRPAAAGQFREGQFRAAGQRRAAGPRRGRGLLAAAPAVLVLALAGCGNSTSGTGGGSSSGQVTVGLITKTETNPFFVKMKEGAEKEAQAKGAKLMTAAGKFDGDNASQVTAIENMVAAGAKGILITPSDTKAIIPAIKKARDKGVLVIALDTPTDPQSAVDALFATNNFTAGELIGKYAKAVEGDKTVKIATLDLAPGITVGVLRHNGFLSGYGLATVDNTAPDQVTAPSVVCSQDTQGDQAKGQTAMENCLQKDPGINLVYTINEPAALGAYTALKAAGKEKDVLIVSVDGGCTGTKAVQDGKIAATSQQYPLKMAQRGVDAVVDYAKNGTKVSGYTDTGVTLIAAKPATGVDSKDVAFGLANCWG